MVQPFDAGCGTFGVRSGVGGDGGGATGVRSSRTSSSPVVAGTPAGACGAGPAGGGAGAGRVPSAILVTRTAVILNRGCLDTGSHSVGVSSLAARACCPPGWSQ